MRTRIERTRSHGAGSIGAGEKGFSLLELLVVLMLLGLTSLLVLPAMGRRLGQLEVRKSAVKLAAVARDLRSKAIHQGSMQRLILLPAENSYEIAKGHTVRLPSDVRIASIAGGIHGSRGEGRQFHFYPNGRMHGGEIEIAGNEGSTSYLTRFDPLSGRVMVRKGSAAR